MNELQKRDGKVLVGIDVLVVLADQLADLLGVLLLLRKHRGTQRDDDVAPKLLGVVNLDQTLTCLDVIILVEGDVDDWTNARRCGSSSHYGTSPTAWSCKTKLPHVCES